MLSDIAFDEAGNMLLGFRDRSGDMNSQTPYSIPATAQGDLLLAAPTGTTGVWNAAGQRGRRALLRRGPADRRHEGRRIR